MCSVVPWVAVRRAAGGTDEPIAIVGMSCRYPGGVQHSARVLGARADGRDAISEFPADRGWELSGLYDPDPDHPGTSYVREGGFVYDAGEFDAGFFGIGAREAIGMDPQQRLLLEATWEASRTQVSTRCRCAAAAGVFCGVMYQDYGLVRAPIARGHRGYLSTGVGGSVSSGRVAYTSGSRVPQ